MNAPAVMERPSLLAIMASKYHMDPQTFANTVRKTAMPGNATNEEFGAFMMVAHEYGLNPILKEIHAFPKKGGGIQPVVSIDGWVSLINQHPQCDGYSFRWTTGEKGELIACECTLYRKDRKHPVVVDEYLAECYRATEPWKMAHRMLRHKALIQAARYAFGFSGIMDEDEAQRISTMRDITPPPPEKPTKKDFQKPDAAHSTPAEGEGGAGDVATASPATLTDNETGEYSAADAFERGIKDRDAGKALRSVPPEWRDSPVFAPLAEAWEAGWRKRDTERLRPGFDANS